MSVRVLVVDDVADVRRLIGAIIAVHDAGWSVVGEASNGQEAIATARRLDPDLVLLDLSMPVMDAWKHCPACAPPCRTPRS